VRIKEGAEGVEYHLDAVPNGDMVVCSNVDTPGTIGKTGMLMAQHSINIARMSWGRERPGGQAITVLNLDSPASSEVLQEMETDEHILWAKAVHL
jgi:D-3-phosphoglycerate dehydrogenase